MKSYTPNNVVGGPSILHCTAKGSSYEDPDYSSSSEVLKNIGAITTLEVVGFVVTPRTFGARVRLSEHQLALWGNSDDFGLLADYPENSRKNTSTLTNLGENDDFEASCQKSLLKAKMDDENFSPVTGRGSRAHITLGCSRPDIHPRDTGYDLLLAVKREMDALSDVTVKTHGISGGAVRGYGDGVWVVYPKEKLTVTAMFSAFHHPH